MTRQSRSAAAALAAAVALPLVLAACGGAEEPTPTGSGSGSSGVRSDTSGASAGDSPTGTSGTSRSGPATGEAGSSGSSPDPEVTVTPSEDETQSSADRASGTAAADGQQSATRLSIPAVGLSTSLKPQGLRDGKVDPKAGEVIWFTGYDRVRPGATGTSVIAGHVVNQDGPDEFAALEHLETGDGIVLGYPDGSSLRLEVTSTDIVDKDDLTTNQDVWGTNGEERRVVLVTCDDELGFREDGHRTANFVAVAEPPS